MALPENPDRPHINVVGSALAGAVVGGAALAALGAGAAYASGWNPFENWMLSGNAQQVAQILDLPANIDLANTAQSSVRLLEAGQPVSEGWRTFALESGKNLAVMQSAVSPELQAAFGDRAADLVRLASADTSVGLNIGKTAAIAGAAGAVLGGGNTALAASRANHQFDAQSRPVVGRHTAQVVAAQNRGAALGQTGAPAVRGA